MKRIAVILAAVALLFSCCGIGHASNTKSLFTAPADPLLGEMQCSIVNVGTKTIEVTINRHATDGTVTTTNGPVALEPGNTMRSSGPLTLLTPFYCEFQVTGSSKTVRAAAIYRNENGGNTMAIPAQ
jgi:hypothetical protein